MTGTNATPERPDDEQDRRVSVRRHRIVPVSTDRRSGRDRRLAGTMGQQEADWFLRVSAGFYVADRSSGDTGEVRVTVCHGLAASVFAAWEPAMHDDNMARFRIIDGQLYRQIGSAVIVSDSEEGVQAAQDRYRGDCHRAYQSIYRRYPDLEGKGAEVNGEIVLKSF